MILPQSYYDRCDAALMVNLGPVWQSPLPGWRAGADEWELGEASFADEDSQIGILTIKLETLIKINCD